MRTVVLYGSMARGRVALVDDADYDLVMRYRWRCQEQSRGPGLKPHGPYAIATIPGSGNKSILMHVLITGRIGTDHGDGDGLNNQRCNLRPATNGQNKANSQKYAGATKSTYKGVYWQSRGNWGRWAAQIRVNGHLRSLGVFTDQIEAARAYDAAAREAWGEFARPNFPDETGPSLAGS